MGQPHEDLHTLRAMKQRLEETKELAKTLGRGNRGERGSLYQAVASVSALVDGDIEAVRKRVDPDKNQ